MNNADFSGKTVIENGVNPSSVSTACFIGLDAGSALLASSLPVLEGVLSALRERYGAIPADMNIGTFDEHAMLGFLANNLWSMRQDEDAFEKNKRLR